MTTDLIKSITEDKETKLQNPEQNISIFKLPHTTVITLLKTTENNSTSTDTNFNVRRQFVKTLTSNGNDETITIVITDETFVSRNR